MFVARIPHMMCLVDYYCQETVTKYAETLFHSLPKTWDLPRSCRPSPLEGSVELPEIVENGLERGCELILVPEKNIRHTDWLATITL